MVYERSVFGFVFLRRKEVPQARGGDTKKGRHSQRGVLLSLLIPKTTDS